MAFLEIDDVIYNELVESFPDSYELKSIATAHLSKLLPNTTKTLKSKKKNTSIRLSEKHRDFLDKKTEELKLNRIDLLVAMLTDVDLNKLGFDSSKKVPYVRRSRLSSEGGFLVSFNPPVYVHDRWSSMSKSAGMTKQLFLELVLGYYSQVGYPQKSLMEE